jgi:integrase
MPTPSNWNEPGTARRAAGVSRLRIYDCRHAAATTWLRAGVPLAEVALRLGHSVEALVTTYVGAINGKDRVASDRIAAALGDLNRWRQRQFA